MGLLYFFGEGLCKKSATNKHWEVEMRERIANFNPGPSALPLSVLEEAREEFLNFQGSGMSIIETSHRSPQFDQVIDSASERIRRLMGLGDEFEVLFVQGGASLQFAMIPLNLCAGQRPVYLNTGTWSTKAIHEAKIQGLDPLEAASSQDREFSYIPNSYEVPEDAAYLHITSNNTIKGTQYHSFPRVAPPLVADMSSDILSRPVDMKPFGLIYAGAQKNLGPAGVTLVIIRRDLLERTPDNLPSMLRYTTYAEKRSMYNTPPAFAIYMVGLVLKWLEEEIGGLDKVAALNQAKADLLYNALDNSGGFYRPTARKQDRSLMNVTFRLADENLQGEFLAQALEDGLGGLKGHKSVGGCRASIYNAISLSQVQALVEFLQSFAKSHG